jgi:hypothetical protein
LVALAVLLELLDPEELLDDDAELLDGEGLVDDELAPAEVVELLGAAAAGVLSVEVW